MLVLVVGVSYVSSCPALGTKLVSCMAFRFPPIEIFEGSSDSQWYFSRGSGVLTSRSVRKEIAVGYEVCIHVLL